MVVTIAAMMDIRWATFPFASWMNTLRHYVEHEIAKRKASRFIAAAWPLHEHDICGAGIQNHVKGLIDTRRALYPTACHHCYAYTTSDGREHASDDGEPHSTAGKPILQALQHRQLVDVCVVVTRIFGGTKLGTGGLVRAYAAAAQDVLEQAEIITKVPTTSVTLQTPFALIDVVKHACTRFNGDIIAQDYEQPENASFTLRVPTAQLAEFSAFVATKSAGRIRASAENIER